MLRIIFISGILIALTLASCKPDPADTSDPDLIAIPFAPANYLPTIPESFPPFEQPEDNMMTIQGIDLGRRLFYDPILSVDSTISCASCHLISSSMTDDLAVSKGVDGTEGRRSAMSLLNVGFYHNEFFWDGRSADLEEQALLPVEDPVEMKEIWSNVEEKLRVHDSYPHGFRKAFGITKRDDIDKKLVTRALAQFQRTLISSGNSRFDRFIRGEIGLEENEINGYLMFFDLVPTLPDAECGHCHNVPLFTTNEYFNNGLDAASSLDDFTDLGRGEVTENPIDNGTFRIPTLRNIALTAPYMHDGRFETLEEVIDHYNSGGKLSPNKHPLISALNLNEIQKAEIVAFLHTLTDTSFTQNPAFQNPF